MTDRDEDKITVAATDTATADYGTITPSDKMYLDDFYNKIGR